MAVSFGRSLPGSPSQLHRARLRRHTRVSAPFMSGCSAVRLAHLLREQGVGGSNPPTPTIPLPAPPEPALRADLPCRMSRRTRSLAIVGPTAVGKTELALELAESIGGDIVSIDSRQIYRGLDIGTAKPTALQRRGIRHHMVDLINPVQVFSAGRFAALARDRVRAIQVRSRPVLLVGGSGLYLSATIDGLSEAPPVNRSLRARLAVRLRKEGFEALRCELRRLDPAAASEIEPGDAVRVLRALELNLTDRRRRAERWESDDGRGLGAMPMMVCLTRPRESLYQRIDSRAVAMFRGGWPEEVEGLLASGLAPGAPGLQSLGYAEVVAYLVAGLPKEKAIKAIQGPDAEIREAADDLVPARPPLALGSTWTDSATGTHESGS